MRVDELSNVHPPQHHRTRRFLIRRIAGKPAARPPAAPLEIARAGRQKIRPRRLPKKLNLDTRAIVRVLRRAIDAAIQRRDLRRSIRQSRLNAETVAVFPLGPVSRDVQVYRSCMRNHSRRIEESIDPNRNHPQENHHSEQAAPNCVSVGRSGRIVWRGHYDRQVYRSALLEGPSGSAQPVRPSNRPRIRKSLSLRNAWTNPL